MGIGPGNQLKEDVTYWAPNTARDDFNNVTWAPPVLLKGRWVDDFEEILNRSGEQVVSNSHVYLSAPVTIGGYLAHGDLTDQDVPLSAGAQEIQAYKSTPDIRYMQQERKAFL